MRNYNYIKSIIDLQKNHRVELNLKKKYMYSNISKNILYCNYDNQ